MVAKVEFINTDSIGTSFDLNGSVTIGLSPDKIKDKNTIRLQKVINERPTADYFLVYNALRAYLKAEDAQKLIDIGVTVD